MTRLRVLLLRIAGIFRRRHNEHRLREEIETHLQFLVQENLDRGLSPEEARAAARRSFGGVERIKELYREQRGLPLVDALRQDFGFALRLLRKDRWVTLVVVLVMGLGIGANTALFSIVDGLLVKALPVRDPKRLIRVDSGEESTRYFWAKYAAWEAIRNERLFENAFAWWIERVDVAANRRAEPADVLWATRDVFDVLGVTPALGRVFHERTDGEGTVVVLGHRFWQRRFGGDPDVLGKSISIQRVPFTIIGVTPSAFFGPEVGQSFDVAIPLRAMTLLPGRERNLETPAVRMRIMARLEPGRTIEGATLALRQAQPRIREATMPSAGALAREDYMSEPLTAVSAARGTSSFRDRYRDPLVVLMVVTALVLFIACANVALLLLARAAGRGRELAVRAALGASRLRLVRQLVAESLLLAAAAAAVGLLIGSWCSRALVSQMTTVLQTVVLDVSLDARALAFTAAASVTTAMLVGLFPAFRVTRECPVDPLKERGEPIIEGRRLGPGGALVVAQISISLVLVVGAGLFLRSFSELANVDLGFEPSGLLAADVDVRGSEDELSERLALFERMCESAESLPGVASAACSPAIPIGFRAGMSLIDVPEEPFLPEGERLVHKNWINENWLRTLGTRLLAGRSFRAAERAGAAPVAVVNEAFARRIFEGRDVVGRTVREDRRTRGIAELTIVGLVEDAVYRSIREPAPPTMYVPLSQADVPRPSFNIVLRPVAGDPAALAPILREALVDVYPEVALTIRRLDDQVKATYNQERVLAMVAGVFGGLALLLAALGLFSVAAHAVSRRIREIGIRMALGADSVRILRMVLGRVAAILVAGILLGGVAGLVTAPVIQSLLFGLPARDPAVFATAAAVLAISAAAAGWLPARRACRVDPAQVLREG